MATITATSLAGFGVRAMTETTLTASDILPYDASVTGSVLVLRNPTAGALSPTILAARHLRQSACLGSGLFLRRPVWPWETSPLARRAASLWMRSQNISLGP
jgi:hypothetical protein